MPDPADLRFRAARPDDAHAIAGLHADSWQRHYRGAYSDAFLDGDVTTYLLAVWTERLHTPHPQARTILAEHDGQVVGLAHTLLGEDATWGALIDNLHVFHALKRQGIGTRLLALTARLSSTGRLRQGCTCGSSNGTLPRGLSTQREAGYASSAMTFRLPAAILPS